MSVVHLLRMVPEGVVSKKLIGLRRMFQTMVLKILREALLAIIPTKMAFKSRRITIERPISP